MRPVGQGLTVSREAGGEQDGQGGWPGRGCGLPEAQSSCSLRVGVGWSARSLSFWEAEGAAGPARPGGW